MLIIITNYCHDHHDHHYHNYHNDHDHHHQPSIIINVIIDLGGAHSVGDVTGGFLLVPRNFQPIHKLPILLTSAHTVFLTMMMTSTHTVSFFIFIMMIIVEV